MDRTELHKFLRSIAETASAAQDENLDSEWLGELLSDIRADLDKADAALSKEYEA